MTTRKMFKLAGLILLLTYLRNVHGQAIKKIDRFVGDRCKTADLVDGACTVLIECQTIYDRLKIDKIYDNVVHCNFIGSSPVVCCPGKIPTPTERRPSTKSPPLIYYEYDEYDDYGVSPTKVSVTTKTTVIKPDVMVPREVFRTKAEIACAKWQNGASPPITSHILNGLPADAGEFPHMAGLGVRSQESGKDYEFVCGGSLISENFVLTAAHCRARRGVPVSIVRLGKTTINTTEDNLDPVDVGVSEFITHDLYNSSQQYHDIALIRLNRTISLSDVVRPACLYVHTNYIGPETELYATGWGQTGIVGDRCKTTELVDGACTVLIECQIIYDRIQIDKNYDNLVHCNFIGSSSVVCCPGKIPTSTARRPSTKSPPLVYFDYDEYDDYGVPPPKVPVTTKATVTKPDIMVPREVFRTKAEIACAKWKTGASPPISSLILGGLPADPGEFPHMAALGVRSEESGKDYDVVCGGSLISENFVLTAAHCRARGDVPVSIVRLGKTSLNNKNDSLDPVDVVVSEFITHHLYSSLRNYHDIALIRLNRTVSLSYVVRPACLYVDTNYIGPETKLYATGWGQIGNGNAPTSNILLKINITSLAFETCNNIYTNLPASYVRKLPNGIIDGQLCAQDPDQRKDVCKGDSGGPLQILSETQVSTVVGVVSIGPECAPGAPLPGIYTSVSYYLQWIERNVWP